MDREHDILKRIVMLLLALAALAERASTMPRPMLRLILWVMRPAEAIVRQRIIAALEDHLALSFESSPPITTDERAEALRLAIALRMLAMMLETLPASAFAQPDLFGHFDRLLFQLRLVVAPITPRGLAPGVAYHDTS